MRAPAAANTASGKPAARPAPDSTVTVSLAWVRRFAVSGESATRVSPGRVSFGTKTVVMGAGRGKVSGGGYRPSGAATTWASVTPFRGVAPAPRAALFFLPRFGSLGIVRTLIV